MNKQITFPRALRGHPFAAAGDQQLFEQINATLGEMRSNIRSRIDEMGETVGNLETSMSAIQNQLNGTLSGGGLPGLTASWGDQVATSEQVEELRNSPVRAKVQIPITPRAEITSIPTSGGALIAPDRDTRIVGLPRRRLTVRALLGRATTSSNLVEYARQTDRDNNAATVAEGALKPESDLGFDMKQAKVATIAHWLKTSRQALDDAGQLRAIIDGELRYGLAVEEEDQLLLGDGVGANMLGLIPQATAYDPANEPAGANKFDVLLNAIAQAEAADLPATGIVVNNIDWMRLQAIKDGEGRYLGDGPMGRAMPSAWGVDVVPSPAIAAGKFLVGAFADAATVFDAWPPSSSSRPRTVITSAGTWSRCCARSVWRLPCGDRKP